MASIINDRAKNGYYIRLTENESPTGKRVKIMCSGLSKKQTQHVLTHVEKIIVAKHSKVTLEHATADWLGKLQGPIRKRLEDLTLVDPVKEVCDATVVGYMKAYISKRTDIAASTKRIYARSLHFTQAFFGNEKKLLDVTPGNAKDFARWLREAGQKNKRDGLAENTARKMLDKLKTVYNSAVDDELILRNPFRGIASSVISNKEKQLFVSVQDVLQVIRFAPNQEFQAIIALSRFGGLRTPSEFRHLRHGDFAMNAKLPTFTVYCQKTAHTGKKTRVVPIFTELRPYLEGLVSQSKALAGEFVFSDKYRLCSDANIFNTMSRIVQAAGIDQWPDLWRNLRASRESELLAMGYNLKDVCEWFGNTQKVVADHYLRSDPESLKRATQQPEETNAQSTAVEIGDLFGDLNTPEPSESDGTEQNSQVADTNRKPMIFRSANKKPSRITRGQMLPQGLEP